jgi:hypothetical protein
MRRKDSKDMLKTIRARFKLMVEADSENRRAALEDIRFVNIPGAQWDANMKKLRGNRPCYEFNKVRVRCKRIVNDIRDNRPSGKCRPVEGGDKKIAEIYEGLIRNILNASHADNATDYAAEYQVEGGMGAWRVNTKYADDSAFNQDIVIEAIENPFCLYCDPTAKDVVKRDAEDWILTERISKTLYEQRYGKVEKVDFEGDTEFDSSEEDWTDEETVRIAEYWYKVPHTKELWLMADGKVVDSETDEAAAIKKDPSQAQIKGKRTVKTHKIKMCIASGSKIIEGPTDWAGRHFPFVMVYGEWKIIDGKLYWWGLPRFARDAQQDYNIATTAISETIAQAPQGKWWATKDQAKGNTDQWAEAHQQNFPWLLYNADPKASGPPIRIGGADVPVALIQQQQIADNNIKDVMGLPDASMGQAGDEKSGRAIYARQQQGEIATFNYKDNLAKAMEFTWEILIDLIPHIYDTDRELRILGTDGAEDYKRVNQMVYDSETQKTIRVNDLAMGKYDVTITTGPSFSTLRQEAAEVYGNMAQQYPELMGFAGDLIMKSLDYPYSEEIAERIRAMLPPQIQQVIDKDKELPPEVEQAMQRVNQAMQQVEQHGQLVQAAAQELEQEKSLNAKDKADIQVQLSKVEVAKANFDAHVAQEMSKLIQTKAGIATDGANLTLKAADSSIKERELSESETRNKEIQSRLESEVGDIEVDEVKYRELIDKVQNVDSLDGMLAQFMQVVDTAMQNLEKKADRKVVGGKTRREGGKLVAEVEYDDGTTKSLAAVREKGNLKIVPDARQ